MALSSARKRRVSPLVARNNNNYSNTNGRGFEIQMSRVRHVFYYENGIRGFSCTFKCASNTRCSVKQTKAYSLHACAILIRIPEGRIFPQFFLFLLFLRYAMFLRPVDEARKILLGF